MKRIFKLIKMVFKRNKKQAKSKNKKPPAVIRKKHDFKFVNTDDVPDIIEKGIIYIVGENGFDWTVTFKCPCGCEETIQLNLLSEARPCWRIIHHKDKTISLSPSINRTVRCKSHFSITRNMLVWWGNQRDDFNY